MVLVNRNGTRHIDHGSIFYQIPTIDKKLDIFNDLELLAYLALVLNLFHDKM